MGARGFVARKAGARRVITGRPRHSVTTGSGTVLQEVFSEKGGSSTIH
jgi:hypothetical protein